MIRVHLAPEPSTFDAEVRQPGLNALAELVGEPSRVRTGPKRPKIADRREDIRSKDFPTYWREALPDLLTAYHRICAYTALYIHRITGAQSVDHMAAKSSHWRDVYEWNNYRLACARVNSRKGVKSPLDPFEIEDGWFELELVDYQVIPGAGVQEPLRTQVRATIHDLHLNDPNQCLARADYADEYLARHTTLDYLERRAPFVARELRRQNKLHPADTVPPA
jgi:hypothetical protein